MRSPALLLAAALLALMLLAPAAADRTYRDLRLDAGEHDDYWLLWWGNEGDTVNLTFELVEGTAVDLYLLPESELYDEHYPNGSFRPLEAWENVTELNFSFVFPDDQGYYFVVDNLNNSRNDTFYNETVFYDLDIIEPEIEFPDIEGALERAALICFGSIVLIVILVVALIVLLSRRKPPAQPAYQPAYQPAPYASPGAGPPYYPPPR